MNHPGEINAILKKKERAYNEFLTATRLLKKALKSEDVEKVAGLIEQRAELMKVVNDLDRKIIYSQQSGSYPQDKEVMRSTAVASSDLAAKLQEIIVINRDCNTVATDRLSQLRRELVTLHEKEKGLHGYHGRSEKIPKFLSVKT